MFYLHVRFYDETQIRPCIDMKYKYLSRAEEYAKDCRKNGLLANKAGFFRTSKIAPKDYEAFSKANPDEAALIDALFEDEALNADTKKLSATVLNLYMKCRFGYGEKEAEGFSVISGHDGEDAE